SASSKASCDFPIPVGPTTTGIAVIVAQALPIHGERAGLGASVVSPEVAGQLLPLDQKAGGTAVRTRDRFLSRLEVGQQPALLGDVEYVAEPHRRMARERGGGPLDRTIAAILGERGERLLDGGGRAPGRPLGRRGRGAPDRRHELSLRTRE